ncbi:MAG: M20/M25/M40 family metallo-hydrolase [Luteitalea sp.]|nr:M20/M25/M40 family metallo-hydrolase [Luteitalea sp.]
MVALLLAAGTSASGPQPQDSWLDGYRPMAQRVIDTSLGAPFAWRRLAELTDTFGPRFSGSANLEHAIRWAEAEMKRDGLENVRLQPVHVPRWVRGTENLEIVEPVPSSLAMLGLGGSVATPADGLRAELLVVGSFEDLRSRITDARGKIVLFNAPFTSYSETVTYRTNSASEAASAGAVAALVRSVGGMGLRTPHTGMMVYSEDVPKIPAAAISAEDAERLARMQARDGHVELRLRMGAQTLPDAQSANVIGEITGHERPEEIVLVGGHIDSWDVGTGASDDGVGCVVTWEALRLMKALDLRPRRTVRVVLFTNEENGLRGGLGYRDAFAEEAAQHVLALESDSGVFAPLRLGYTGPDRGLQTLSDIATLLTRLGIDRVGAGGGGADISPIARAGNVPMMSLGGDPRRYFTIHHTQADTIERITSDEVSRAAAAIAVVAYIVADMPQRLGAYTATN